MPGHRSLYAPLLLLPLSAALAWLTLYTGIWPLAIAAGAVAGVVTGGRYIAVFLSGMAGGAVASAIWLLPLLAPGAGRYVQSVGALASIPGELLVALTFIFTALYVGCGGVIGAWIRDISRAGARA